MPVGEFKAGKAFLTAGLLLLFGALAYGVVQLNRKTPLPPLPSPNGHDDFVRAQKLLVGNPADFGRASTNELRKHLEVNAQVLKLVREGLAKECRIELLFSTNYLDGRHLNDVKKVTRLLEAEGRLAELERRTNDAARIYVETIRFGRESCRGGVMMDHLVGIACGTIGLNALQRIADSLDAATCGATSRQLQQLERQQEPLADVLRNEAEWVRRTVPVWQRIPAMIPLASLTGRAEKNFLTKCNQSGLQLKRMIVDLAARAYELDRGKRPKDLDALVPDYLDAVPVEPATGMKLTN